MINYHGPGGGGRIRCAFCIKLARIYALGLPQDRQDERILALWAAQDRAAALRAPYRRRRRMRRFRKAS